ncbi:hypothetical protein J6590_088712 [Homalodisca vitripennis]|nr:hypothetical protein J6590_088712 [Homalodisca vitripennis]
MPESEPHPASARPYQASLTKNVLPLERSGARLTEREQGKAKKERGWPAIVKIYIYLRRKKQGDKRRQNYPERLPTQVHLENKNISGQRRLMDKI